MAGQGKQSPYYQLHRNVDLRPFNTMGVSAVANQFVTVESSGSLDTLRDRRLATPESQVLGGGSNVLFVGRIQVPVLYNRIRFLEVVREEQQQVIIRVGAGNRWHDLVRHAVSMGWGGIENLALIPGTVGAAPIQNIGAYGVELSETFESLEAYDLEHGGLHTFDSGDCDFGYRDSVFKRSDRGRFVIVSVTLCLTKDRHRLNHSYRSLSDWLDERGIDRPSISDIFEAVVEIRHSKLPDPEQTGNAGSFFKNPVVERELIQNLQRDHGDVPFYPAEGERFKIPAGWLIETAGWKGYREGDAGIFEKQALVIVNHGGASGEEILRLSEKVRRSVRDIFGIELEREVSIVGSVNGDDR